MIRRYLITFTLIIVIPIFLILVLFFRYFETILVKNLSVQSLEATRQLAQALDEEAKRLALLTSTLAHNEELLSQVYAYKAAAQANEKYRASRSVAEQLDALFNYTNQIGGIFFIFAGQEILYHRNFPISLTPPKAEDAWYQQLLMRRGKTRILQTFTLHTAESPEGPFLSCGIALGTGALRHGLEAIVVSFKSRVYSESVSRQLPENMERVFILNEDNDVLLQNRPGEIALEAFSNSNGIQTLDTARGRFLVISYLMPYSGMRIVKLFDYVRLTSGLRTYSRYARATLVGLVLLFFAYTGVFFRSIIRPLRNVIQKMEQMGKGNMTVQVETKGFAELKSLSESFNQMVGKVRALTQQIEQKERQRAQAEIDALQFQINPHFLSNTLNAIKMMATLVRAKNIQKMTASLMAILAASFKGSSSLATIEQQLTNLESYIYIMKVRFGDSFDVNFSIDDNIKKLYLLKMLIQPILENAILHGIREIEQKGWIEVNGWQEGKQLYIDVSDNGVGMPPEVQEAIWEKDEHPHQGFTCIGLRNVHERIRLNYGEPYGLTIRSERGRGATVRFVLPVIDEISARSTDV